MKLKYLLKRDEDFDDLDKLENELDDDEDFNIEDLFDNDWEEELYDDYDDDLEDDSDEELKKLLHQNIFKPNPFTPKIYRTSKLNARGRTRTGTGYYPEGF